MENISQKDLIETFERFDSDDNHLRPIDLLIKHRELFGFDVLDSIDSLVASCLAAGPEQSHLDKPLTDDGAGLIKKLRSIAAMRKFCQEELQFIFDMMMTKNLSRTAGADDDDENDDESAKNDNNNNTSPTSTSSPKISTMEFTSICVPRLMRIRGLINAARTADSRHLRIRLHTLQLQLHVASNGVVSPPVFPSSFKIRVTVSWKTILGKDKNEVYVTGPELFQSPDFSGCSQSNQSNNNHETMMMSRSGTFSGTSTPSSSTTPSQQNFLASPAPSSSIFSSASPTTTTTTSTANLNNTLNAASSSSATFMMSCDRSAPSTQPSVNISTMFRTSCDGSCTIRVSIETANGMEFAKGSIRASFLPGDGAPCASFSVPLVRHAKLVSSKSSTKESTSASVSSSKKSSSTTAKKSSSDREVLKKNKEALAKIHTPVVEGGMSGSSFAGVSSSSSSASVTNRHQRTTLFDSNNSDQTVVGSLSMDIDSIASSFINLVAMKKQQEMFEEREKRKREESERLEREERGEEVEEHSGNSCDSEKKQEELPTSPEQMTVAYFLREENFV